MESDGNVTKKREKKTDVRERGERQTENRETETVHLGGETVSVSVSHNRTKHHAGHMLLLRSHLFSKMETMICGQRGKKNTQASRLN